MTVTIRRSTLVVLVAVLVIAAGVFAVQGASAASSTPVVYVATGENFPDALGAASAAAVRGGPVLLVQRDAIPQVTRDELTRLAPDTIVVAGGTAVVSVAVFDQLKAYAPSVVRAAGLNRYSTAVEVSKSAFPVSGGGSAALEARVVALEAKVAQLEALLAGVSLDGTTLLFEGMNLQVVNGTGSTSGTPNGVGNVIIGYNETPDSTPAGYRSGSHSLIVGLGHTYTNNSYGGIVSGYHNTIDGPYASVTGGGYNTASGFSSSVAGGSTNTASGWFSSVTGGANNTAYGEKSSVTGGSYNTASGWFSSVTGGANNAASGIVASVAGGNSNVADGRESSICGGEWNEAVGELSSISGGKYNDAIGQWSSVSGGQYNVAQGTGSSVLGGTSNTVIGDYGHYPN